MILLHEETFLQYLKKIILSGIVNELLVMKKCMYSHNNFICVNTKSKRYYLGQKLNYRFGISEKNVSEFPENRIIYRYKNNSEGVMRNWMQGHVCHNNYQSFMIGLHIPYRTVNNIYNEGEKEMNKYEVKDKWLNNLFIIIIIFLQS